MISQALESTAAQRIPSARALITAGGLLGSRIGAEFDVSEWPLLAHPESFSWVVGWSPNFGLHAA